jgi:hypothetical protein
VESSRDPLTILFEKAIQEKLKAAGASFLNEQKNAGRPHFGAPPRKVLLSF